MKGLGRLQVADREAEALAFDPRQLFFRLGVANPRTPRNRPRDTPRPKIDGYFSVNAPPGVVPNW